MRLLQLLCIFALASYAFGAVLKCSSTTASDQTLDDIQGYVGCDGTTQRSSSIYWTIKASPGTTRVLFFENSACTIGSYHTLVIKQGARTLFNKGGVNPGCDISADSPMVITPDEPVTVSYLWSGSYSAYPKFSIGVKIADDYQRFFYVQTGKTQALPGSSAGAGWTFVSFQGYHGSLVSFGVTLAKYEGLTDPILYLQNDKLPTLSKYIVSNSTVCRASTWSTECTGLATVASPASGQWTLGVYATGPYSGLSITPRWLFNATALPNGGKISKDTATEEVYQVNVPMSSSKLNIKLARLPPGGSSQILIGTGFSPVATADYTLLVNDTAAFSEVNIPSPYKSSASNPGQYIIRVIPKSTPAGSVFQATW